MTSTLTALNAAINANPADRTVRLIYADALDESGEPVNVAHAEFIRAQVELESLPDGDPRRDPLVNRCDDLFAEHWIEWWQPVCTAAGLPEPYVPKHRLRDRVKRFVKREKRELGAPYKRTTDNPGVYTIRSDDHGFSAQFIAGFPELLAINEFPSSNIPEPISVWFPRPAPPPSEARVLPPVVGHIGDVFAHSPVHRLRFTSEVTDREWDNLDGPHLAKVTEIRFDRIPSAVVARVACSEHLRNLTTLKLLLPQPAEAAMRTLLAYPTWTGLQSLTLFGVTPPGVIQTLADRCQLNELEALTFGISEVREPASVSGLLGGAIGAMLNEMLFRLGSMFPLPPGPIRWPEYWPALTALAQSPVLPRLRQLRINEGGTGANPLAGLFGQFDLPNPDADADPDPDNIFPGTLVNALADGLNTDKLERLELPRTRLSSTSRAELFARFDSRLVLV